MLEAMLAVYREFVWTVGSIITTFLIMWCVWFVIDGIYYGLVLTWMYYKSGFKPNTPAIYKLKFFIFSPAITAWDRMFGYSANTTGISIGEYRWDQYKPFPRKVG